jgi:hypothetical protein
MAMTLRPIAVDDVSAAGRICYEAFKAIAGAHNFPPGFPDLDIAVGLITQLTGHPAVYGVVAELDGRLAGRAISSTSAMRSLASARSRSIRRRRMGASGQR